MPLYFTRLRGVSLGVTESRVLVLARPLGHFIRDLVFVLVSDVVMFALQNPAVWKWRWRTRARRTWRHGQTASATARKMTGLRCDQPISMRYVTTCLSYLIVARIINRNLENFCSTKLICSPTKLKGCGFGHKKLITFWNCFLYVVDQVLFVYWGIGDPT